MNSIANVIQGPEKTLFQRVLHELQISGIQRKYLIEFEGCKNKTIDEILDKSVEFLRACDYW